MTIVRHRGFPADVKQGVPAEVLVLSGPAFRRLPHAIVASSGQTFSAARINLTGSVKNNGNTTFGGTIVLSAILNGSIVLRESRTDILVAPGASQAFFASVQIFETDSAGTITSLAILQAASTGAEKARLTSPSLGSIQPIELVVFSGSFTVG